MTLYNFALAANGAIATAGSYAVESHPASMAIDGSDLTYAQSHGSTTTPGWVSIDLGAPQYITEVRQLTTIATLRDVRLEASTDGVSWVTIQDVVPAYNGWSTVLVGGLTYRYWRFSTTAYGTAQWYQPNAIEVLGPVEAPPPPTSPAPDYIEAWLDGIEANYVPTVDDWLAAN